MPVRRASIGISAHLGWAATSVVAVHGGAMRVIRTDRIETAPANDREAAEPYHVAGGFHGLTRVPQPNDPEATLKRGLRKQLRATARALGEVTKAVAAESHEIRSSGMLVSRGRPAPTIEKAIGSHTQIHIQEGLAVRDSIRSTLEAMGAKVRDLDQKTLLAIASEELGRSEKALMAELSALAPENGGAWRKEEKLAALAAWIALPRGTRTS